ncbi:serum response factor-binding protein 1-like [Branchiostoma floridae]|uniref:Serum response factor-binding protein 1 n=1 Tax=Branchiostoma floridae TaxID=7739 RepID=A0A9J7KD30_BRAFL|nr:serum response factor-binding protein 1-like [Branchiostoma floridae]
MPLPCENILLRALRCISLWSSSSKPSSDANFRSLADLLSLSLQGLKPDDVTKAGLFADLDEHKVLSNPASSSQDRAMARLISHKALKAKLDTVRAKFSIVPDQKMVSHMKKTVKDKQPGHKAKKTADKTEQMKTGNRPAENTGKTQTQTDSTVENTEQMSDVIVGQTSSHGESSVSDVGEEGKIHQSTSETKTLTESPSTVEIDVSTRNSESESEDDEEDSEEEMEEDADSEMEEISSQMTESPTESKTESQVNLSESRETNDQLSTKRTEPSTAKRKGPRKAACDAEEDEDADEEDKEETTVTEGDDMFLREGDPDPEEDTDGRKTTPDSGGGLGVPAVARALPGESLFIGSLSGGRRGRHVKKGKFEKKMGKRPMERGTLQKFAARGKPQQHTRAPGAGKVTKPSSSDSPAHLHPSWAAKRKQKEQAGQIAAFQGKKIVFDD